MSMDSGRRSRPDDVPSVERLLTLSDGVVAIALTLLVLQLKVPSVAQVADPSSLLGQYSANPLAVDIFAINLLLASLATQATLVFGRRKGLLFPGSDVAVRRAEWARATATALIIGLSIGLAWVSTSMAMYCWLLLAFAPRAVDRWFVRQAAPR
jgi:hypothetical protein